MLVPCFARHKIQINTILSFRHSVHTIKVSYIFQKSTLDKLQPTFFGLGNIYRGGSNVFFSYLLARTHASEENIYFYRVPLLPSKRRSCQATFVNCGWEAFFRLGHPGNPYLWIYRTTPTSIRKRWKPFWNIIFCKVENLTFCCVGKCVYRFFKTSKFRKLGTSKILKLRNFQNFQFFKSFNS